MIQPHKSGTELLDEIEGLSLSDEKVALWWLGQSGFVIKWREAILLIDPYLSDYLTLKYAGSDRPHIRMTAAPFRGTDVRRADLILATHKHSDHLDPGAVPDILRRLHHTRLVVPAAILEHSLNLGVDPTRLVSVQAGHPFTYVLPDGQSLVINPIPAAHEQLEWSPESGYSHLGYVLSFGQRSIYHSGDCVPYDGLLEWLRPFQLDAALLPINGRDPRRGVPGNFSIAEAAELAVSSGAEWLIPMHYDMFTFNTANVYDFVSYMRTLCPLQKFRILRSGECLVLSGTASRHEGPV